MSYKMENIVQMNICICITGNSKVLDFVYPSRIDANHKKWKQIKPYFLLYRLWISLWMKLVCVKLDIIIS